jgi:hypothetical protein
MVGHAAPSAERQNEFGSGDATSQEFGGDFAGGADSKRVRCRLRRRGDNLGNTAASAITTIGGNIRERDANERFGAAGKFTNIYGHGGKR